MKLKELYRCIACASLVAPTLVFAQQGSEPEIEEVVVTGSLIRGTPVDAALPVEVYSQDDLALSGSPSALDFAKSLSISGATTGESYYFGGAGLTGSVQYNLRGIGSDKTLSLFNGRRVTQNTSVIPSIALQRTEILKDGAAVTYGADATGGVVNFISRDSFEGIEIQSSYKAIDGSDGDWNVGIVGGFSGDAVAEVAPVATRPWGPQKIEGRRHDRIVAPPSKSIHPFLLHPYSWYCAINPCFICSRPRQGRIWLAETTWFVRYGAANAALVERLKKTR